MFTIDNKITIDLTLEDYVITRFNFVKLFLDQNWDLEIPKLQLDLKFKTISDNLEFITKRNFQIKLTIGADRETSEQYDFLTSNISIRPSEEGFDITIFALSDYGEFNNTPHQISLENTSNKILESMTHIKTEVSYTGDDKQTYLNPNNTERHFVHKILETSYIDDNDFVVSALNIDGTLVAKPYSDIEKETETIFSNTEKKEGISFSNFIYETDRAIFDKAFMNGKSLRLVRFVSNENDQIDTEITGIGEDNTVVSTQDFPSRVDNGNCHDNYYISYLNNLKQKMSMESNKVFIEFKDKQMDETTVKLLDVVSLFMTNGSDGVLEQFKNNYFVIGKTLKMTTSSVNNVITLSRREI